VKLVGKRKPIFLDENLQAFKSSKVRVHENLS
jgi:hypothetical protein